MYSGYEQKSDEDQLEDCIDRISRNPFRAWTKNPQKRRSEWQIAAERSLWNKDYDRAIEYSTRGLQETARWSKQSMDLYYARAKALKNLQLYEESLLDIERAFKMLEGVFTYPIPNFWKKEKAQLIKKVATIKHTKRNKRNYQEEIPVLSYSKNNRIPGYSDAIDLVYDPKYGRHFKATKPINTGDVILVDKSQLSQLSSLPISSRHACHHCLKYCRALLPCKYCTYATYCSEKCREEAYREYHEIECDFENSTSNVHFAVKLFLKITENGSNVEEAIEYCEKLDAMDADAEEEFLDPDNVEENHLKTILNLSVAMKKNGGKTSTIFDSAKMALMLPYAPYKNGARNTLGLAKLLLRLCYIYDTQTYCVDIATDEEPIISTHNLYPLLRLLRHSCCANTIFSLHKGTILALRAATDISPGDKITFNFLDKSMACRSDYISRDFILEENHISCDCKACMQNFSFKPQIPLMLNISEHLQQQLLKCRIDVDSMWELLKLMNNCIKNPYMGTEILKASISDAYQGKEFFLLPAVYDTVKGLESLLTVDFQAELFSDTW